MASRRRFKMAFSNGGCKLLVKHLPGVFSNADKEDLLKYFGAKTVICMGQRSKMKDTAFAEFSDEGKAAKALERLHQLEVLGRRLVVEYATKQHDRLAAQHSNRMSPKKELDTSEQAAKESVTLSEETKAHLISGRRKDGIAPKLGIKYPSNPSFSYRYPPPTASVLTNIAHTLACVPKFYTQVLHLMNKMNLPTPFGNMTPTPPITGACHPGIPGDEQDDDTYLSSEESEIESDEEEKERRAKEQSMFGQPQQVTKPKPEASLRKRPKLHPTQGPLTKKPKTSKTKKQYQPIEAAFEQPSGQQQRKIAFNLTDAISSIFESGYPPLEVAFPPQDVPRMTEGFGRFAPLPELEVAMETLEEEEEPSEESDEFISLRELKSNRLSIEEISSMSSFKKYSPGDPTSRLYVKNLARQTDDKDLRYVFGRYVDFTSEDEKDRFDIRLMKEGRMKGQAFVTLPSENMAKRALREVHGYLLHSKPIIIQFARSAKAKETK